MPHREIAEIGPIRMAIHYRRDVDGIRALAVMPVVLFHAGLTVMSGGFVGVDIFFVISGFVITSKLISDIDDGRFSIADFYARRIRRLLPAMAAMLAAVYAVGLVLLLPPAMADLCSSMLATLGFSANIYFWKASGYFDAAAQTRPLLHMWSLAVEEQFYLFIPFVLVLLRRRVPHLLWPILAVAAVVSLGLSIAMAGVAPTANFFMLPTRAWELLAGALVAIAPLPNVRNRVTRELGGAVALALMLVPTFLYDESWSFPGLTAVPPVLGAVLAIYLGRSDPSTVTRLLGHRVIVGIGLISYSLYLVHWPLIVFTRTWLVRDPTIPQAGSLVAASLLLGWASWKWVETPFRRNHGSMDRRAFIGAGAVLCSLAVFAGFGSLSRGLPQRMPDFATRPSMQASASPWMNGRCFLDNQPASDWAGRDCIRTHTASSNALLWGDSFAAHYIVGLLKNAGRLDYNVIQYTYAGCPPVLNYRSYARPGCEDFNNNVFNVIRDFNIKVVVISARWDGLGQRGYSGVGQTVRRLREDGVTVYVIGPSPMFAFDVDTLHYRGAGVNGAGRASWYTSFNSHLSDRIRAQAGSAYIDPLPTFCNGERCDYLRNGNTLFNDYGHFSSSGSDTAVQSYFPLYRKVAGEALVH